MPAALGEGLLKLRRTRVRFPPPPRAVRLRTGSSERCWRCADTSLDTVRTRKDTDWCPVPGMAISRTRRWADRSSARLDQVEELLTARPSVLRPLRDLGPEVRKMVGPWGPAPTDPEGRRRREPQQPETFPEFLWLTAGTRWCSLRPTGTRCYALFTHSELGRCHTGDPAWSAWIRTTRPSSRHWADTGASTRFRTSWTRATAAAGAAIRSGSVASSSLARQGWGL